MWNKTVALNRVDLRYDSWGSVARQTSLCAPSNWNCGKCWPTICWMFTAIMAPHIGSVESNIQAAKLDMNEIRRRDILPVWTNKAECRCGLIYFLCGYLNFGHILTSKPWRLVSFSSLYHDRIFQCPPTCLGAWKSIWDIKCKGEHRC